MGPEPPSEAPGPELEPWMGRRAPEAAAWAPPAGAAPASAGPEAGERVAPAEPRVRDGWALDGWAPDEQEALPRVPGLEQPVLAQEWVSVPVREPRPAPEVPSHFRARS